MLAVVAAGYLVSRAMAVIRSRHRRATMTERERRLFDLEQRRMIAVACMAASCAAGLLFVAVSLPLLALAALAVSVVCLGVAAALSFYLGLRGGGHGSL